MKKKLDSSQNLINQAEINELFSQITPREVEQFYKTYQLWSKHQEIARIQQEISILKEKQAQNAAQMQSVTPSAVAFATLAQLRASGVEDIDLLDRMLERGEEWLDHTMQLLERCEELNVIRGNYTQWCEHALDGAYEWMGSMDDASLHDYFHAEAVSEEMPLQALMDADPNDMVTEDQLLRKLMSEDGNITKRNTVPLARITQDLPPLPAHENEDTEDEITTNAEMVEDVEDVDGNDFPVEIEEPEAEASADQEQALAEQQAYQEDTLPDEPDEHLANMFPVEIEELANPTAEVVDHVQPLPTDENVDIEEHDLNEEKIYATADQAEATTDTLTGTSITTANDASIESDGIITSDDESVEPASSTSSDDEPVELIDPVTPDNQSIKLDEPATSDNKPVEPTETTISAASLQEAEPTEIDDAPDSEENEPGANTNIDSSAVAEIQTEEPVEQVPSEIAIEAAQDESSEPEEPSVAVAAETAITPETTEDSSVGEPVGGESAQGEPSDEPIMATATTTQEESSAQWPFVYQEIADTAQQESAQSEVSAPDNTVKKISAQTQQTKKKPRNEASRKSVKKKPGFFRRWLARIFRR